MKQTKKFSRKFSLLTIFILFMSIITSGAYAAKLPFTDVPEKAWYYDDVKSAYESDLISGKKPTKYAPDDNMTAAEAVKLAAAMYMLKNEGKVNFSSSKPWYKVYVDYAKQKNLITDDLDWNKKITRAGYMQIFANILTDEEAKKNEVADGAIPDVPMTHPSAKAIYKLYRAGIVTGIDEKKNCSPASNIKRSEVAAILIRMMDVKRRLGFNLGGGTTPGTTPPPGGTTPPPPATTPLKITKQPQNVVGDYKGEAVTLEVKVEGGKTPYNYQWQNRKVGERDYSNIRIVGEVTNVLTWIVEGEPYEYRCIITDANGDKVTSAEARIELKAGPLRITNQPPEVIEGKKGDIATLTVDAAGGKKPYKYSWACKIALAGAPGYHEFTKEGANTNTIKVPVVPEDNCPYYYYCSVIDADGKVVFSVPTLVRENPATVFKITKQPQEKQFIPPESKGTLEVQVEGGTPPYSYKWKEREFSEADFRDSSAEGNTTNILRPTIEKFEGIYFYKCIITDATGKSIESNPANVTRLDFFHITEQPSDITSKVGDLRMISVTVKDGKKPYTYEWREIKKGELESRVVRSLDSVPDILKFTVQADTDCYFCIITDSRGIRIMSRKAKIFIEP